MSQFVENENYLTQQIITYIGNKRTGMCSEKIMQK